MIERLGLLAALLLNACATPATPALQAVGPAIVRNSPEAGPDVQVAAYVRLYNPNAAPDRLVGLSCTCADAVEIHNTFNREMHTLESHDVPASGYMEIAPGSPTHLMLMGVREPIEPGETVRMTLMFERAGPLEIDFIAVENSRAGWDAHSANH
jgi:periplasmic copper chaperone A